MERVLVIGLGEVGRPLYELICECGKYKVYGYDIDESKSVNKLEEIPRAMDVLHIAFPYTRGFVEKVVEYVKMFSPRIVIIHSTVAPGTTRKIHSICNTITAFSPVRGKHPNIKKHLRFWTKWVATLPKDREEEVVRHLKDIGFRIVIAPNPESLELAKLWETVYRAIMIASWQELHRIARIANADIETIARFIKEVHEVLHDRPIYFPSYIGGHCLIPNTRILNEFYSSKLLEFVLESNEKRAKELEDPNVAKEVEKVKEVALEVINLEYYKDP